MGLTMFRCVHVGLGCLRGRLWAGGVASAAPSRDATRVGLSPQERASPFRSFFNDDPSTDGSLVVPLSSLTLAAVALTSGWRDAALSLGLRTLPLPGEHAQVGSPRADGGLRVYPVCVLLSVIAALHTATSCRTSGKDAGLLPRPPLRTVRAGFLAYGSSTPRRQPLPTEGVRKEPRRILWRSSLRSAK